MNSTLAALFLGFALADGSTPAANGPLTYLLREKVEVGTQTKSKVHLTIQGKIKTGKEDETLAGQALLEYPETVLAVAADGLAGKLVRQYVDARAKFVVGTNADARQLRPGSRLLVGDHENQKLNLWSPAGPMTSDELELVQDLIDTTRLPGLLPKDAVPVGGTWKPDASVITSLCDLDHFIDSSTECKLEKLDQGIAVITLVGEAHGLATGAEVKTQITATLQFDMEKNFIQAVTWRQNDSRGPSPVSPAGSFDVNITISRSQDQTESMTKEALASLKTEPTPASKLVVYEDTNKQYRFYHDRDWHVTALRNDTAVMRRMSGGDFVAQLNVTVLGPRAAGTQMNTEEFQAMIEKTADLKIEEIIRTENLPTDGSFQMQLVVAKGSSGQIPLSQRHYLATSGTGSQVVFSFITEPAMEERLGKSDMSLVGTVEFGSRTAALDTEKK